MHAIRMHSFTLLFVLQLFLLPNLPASIYFQNKAKHLSSLLDPIKKVLEFPEKIQNLIKMPHFDLI